MRTSLIKIAFLIVAAAGFVRCTSASWYWPFDTDPDSTNKPPRLHRLMQKANEYIEFAEEEALDGNADKSIEYYREALKELDRVVLENPDRAESPEFAPLRTKRATCSAAIDSIRFAQVNENERAVSVSNTENLARKWRKKHGLHTPEDEEFEKREAAKTNEVENVEQPATNKLEKAEPPVTETNALTKSAQSEEEDKLEMPATNRVEATATGLSRLEQDNRRNHKIAVPKSDGSIDGDVKAALVHMRNEDYAIAGALMEKQLEKNPKNLNLLLIHAAAQTGAGQMFAARRTLERAMRSHPKSYLPYYNLANLALQMGEDVSIAREYYDLGRTVGGPVNEALEKKLK